VSIARFSTPWLVFLACLVCQPLQANPTLRVGGRLDLDVAKYDEDVTPLDSGTDLRRLRLEIGGSLSKKIGYYLLADFSDGSYGAEAAWLRYRADRRNEFYAGRLEIPFSLQQVTPSLSNLFMERALPVALSRHYGTGVAYIHMSSKWSWRAGLFGDDELNFGGTKPAGTALAVRVGRRLRAGESRFWLGAAAMVQDAMQPERIRARPESSVANEYLVNTSNMFGIAKTSRLGLEGVWKKDQWSLQGEWIQYHAQRDSAEDVTFRGGYVEASRMFNGRRRFNFRRGEWMSPEIGDTGAWELSARISRIDLQDGAVTGGEETNYSLGLNYYINPINRIMFNWIKADARPNKRGIDESPSTLQFRLQLGF